MIFQVTGKVPFLIFDSAALGRFLGQSFDCVSLAIAGASSEDPHIIASLPLAASASECESILKLKR